MEIILEILKPKLLKALLILALFSWGIFASFQALSNKKKLVLIGIDANGTRIINSNTDPLFKTELINFLHHYLSQSYNFTPENFSKTVGEATNLMAESLWKNEAQNISRLKSLVESTGLVQIARIKEISQIDQINFQALIEVEQKSRLEVQKLKIKVSIKIKSIDRDEHNPWGIEVLELREETL